MTKKTKEQVGILVIWTEQKSNWKKYVWYPAKYQLIKTTLKKTILCFQCTLVIRFKISKIKV